MNPKWNIPGWAIKTIGQKDGIGERWKTLTTIYHNYHEVSHPDFIHALNIGFSGSNSYCLDQTCL